MNTYTFDEIQEGMEERFPVRITEEMLDTDEDSYDD